MKGAVLQVQIRRADPIDKGLLIGIVVLAWVGVAVIYSATRQVLANAGYNPSYYLIRQSIWVCVGMVVMLAVSRIDYRRFEIATTALYIGSILALLGVYVIGSSQLGATRWYVFGPLQIQPSEFAVLAVILAMSTYCGRRPEGLAMYDVSRMLLMSGLPLALIVLQPDLGTAIILMFVVGAMFVVAGVPPRFMILLGAIAALGATMSVYFGLLRPYQVLRLVSFLNQNATNNKSLAPLYYQVSNAKSAIGAGGIFGAGAFKGYFSTLGYVPEQRTDYIFTAIGEQFGLIGTISIVLLLSYVGFRIYCVARDAKEPGGRLLCVGIFIFFAFSCFQNIGMTLGIMPVTGIPLPLLSYGGSSALVFFLCAGAVLAVSRRRTG